MIKPSMTLARPVKERIVGRAAPPMCIAAKHSALCNRPACLPACLLTNTWNAVESELSSLMPKAPFVVEGCRVLQHQTWQDERSGKSGMSSMWQYYACLALLCVFVCHFYCWEGRVVFFSAAFCKVQAMVLAATKNKGEKDTVLVNAGLLSPDVRKQ